MTGRPCQCAGCREWLRDELARLHAATRDIMDDSLGSKAREHANVEEIARLRAEVAAAGASDRYCTDCGRLLVWDRLPPSEVSHLVCPACMRAEVARLTREIND